MNDTTLPPPPSSVPRPRLTTNIWEDEGTLCYQIDAKGICVARRQDNDMINGTKLLNVVGMSRGKRDGILKNEKGRVVVKVGAMHLKGVWITFYRAKELSAKFKVLDLLYPLFEEDPSIYLCTFNDKNPSTSRYMDYLRQKHPQSSPTTSPTSSSFHPKMGLNLSLNHETTNKHMYNEPSEGIYIDEIKLI
ncbi:DNA-binding domain of Mlu1-box binding protein MBP1 [Backusella circina FSU 941]|nr:DNA-binding domain of Mlu1-box binding protein MBP1 [Backusella circina FSU 941]